MPVVLRKKGYSFMFFASDADERPHIHVKRSGKSAKFWMVPVVLLEKNSHFRPHEINEAERLIEENRDFLLERWNAFFGK